MIMEDVASWSSCSSSISSCSRSFINSSLKGANCGEVRWHLAGIGWHVSDTSCNTAWRAHTAISDSDALHTGRIAHVWRRRHLVNFKWLISLFHLKTHQESSIIYAYHKMQRYATCTVYILLPSLASPTVSGNNCLAWHCSHARKP